MKRPSSPRSARKRASCPSAPARVVSTRGRARATPIRASAGGGLSVGGEGARLGVAGLGERVPLALELGLHLGLAPEVGVERLVRLLLVERHRGGECPRLAQEA